MDHRIRLGVLIAGLGCLALPARAQQSATDSLPPGVTDSVIAQGKRLFTGRGLCHACHGPQGKGAVGPNLTDTLWIHSEGRYDQILATIVNGVSAQESRSRIVMPPRGGSALKDEELRAVAAYVWSLSR